MDEYYIPGFTPRLEGEAVRHMAVGGAVAGGNPDVAATRAALANELTITPRELAAAPIANNGEVSPFTTNPYMVVNYGADPNNPTFQNTLNLDPTKVYRLINKNTGAVLISDPSDPTSLARLALQANQLSGNQPTDADWELYTGATGGEKVASDYPNQVGGILGALLQYGIPLGLSFIPGVGWAGSAALTGAGATAGKLISNYSLEDALTAGALTAATAGLMKAPILEGGGSISGAIGDAIGLGATTPTSNVDALTALGVNPDIASQIASGALSDIGSTAVGAGGGALASTAGTDILGNFIQVPGNVGSGLVGSAASNLPSSFLSGALGAASGALSGFNYGDQIFDQPQGQQQPVDAEQPGWDVIAPAENVITPPPASLPDFIPPLTSIAIPPLAGTELPQIVEQPPEGSDNGWTVNAPKENVVIPPPASLPTIIPPLTSVNIPPLAGTQPYNPPPPEKPPANNDIVVTAKPTPTKLPGALDTVLATIPSMAALPSTPQPTTPTPDKQLTLEDYLRLAGLLSTTIGAVGSAASNKNNTDISGLIGAKGPLNPVFSAQLPAPNLQPAAPRQMNVDWERYAYGPEQSFFTNVPQGQPNTSKAYTGYAEGGAAGSSHRGSFAVGGPGDGRDDKIPAMLSDGEYVMDAETVAMLGNGSSKAGAKALDKFRVAVRKHKGRNLAKGKFSVNAKKPEQYLKGRK